MFHLWINQWRRKHATGEEIVVRYADDFLVAFQQKDDAQRLLLHLRERLGQFALELHPNKTRLIEFGRFAKKKRTRRGLGSPDTFDFLGFTHLCGVSREGGFVLMRHSASKRMGRKLKAIRAALCKRRHQPIGVQGRWLARVFRGYANYHAVPTNSRAVNTFRGQLIQSWYRSLKRRSQKAPDRLEEDEPPRPTLDTAHPDLSSLAPSAFRRQTLEVRARCGSAARRDLCGGRGATRVPTATETTADLHLRLLKVLRVFEEFLTRGLTASLHRKPNPMIGTDVPITTPEEPIRTYNLLRSAQPRGPPTKCAI